MSAIRKYFRKLRYKLKLHNLPRNLYAIGQGSVLRPFGIKIQFPADYEDRLYVTIGNNCLIDAKFIFETKTGVVKIGNNVHIGNATFITKSSIIVGSDVTMAWGIMLYDHDSHSIHWDERKNDNHQCYQDFHNHGGNNIMNKDWSHVKTKPIVIHDKVWIGFDATILKGVTVGEGAVIGAKSVVTKDVPPWSVVAGNPAKVVKYIDQKI